MLGHRPLRPVPGDPARAEPAGPAPRGPVVTTQVAPVVAHYRFPTVVTSPDGGTVREARTVITIPQGDQPARLLVWAAPGDPLVDAALDVGASTIAGPRTSWVLVTDGGSYGVAPGRSCGCGNRLKHWTPPQLAPLRMGRLP